MQMPFHRIGVCLWFDDQAEDAARFYTSVFPDSRILTSTRYTKESAKVSGRPEGSIMTVAFELEGHAFTALNGGPTFRLTEAMSIVVNCKSQDEVDHYWSALSKGGDERAQRCGWLKDRFGVSWQIVPVRLLELLSDPDPDKAQRAGVALLTMKKIDLEAIGKAVA